MSATCGRAPTFIIRCWGSSSSRHQLAERGILGLEEDHGVHKSIYGHDPDGLLFEVTWFIPPALLTEEDKNQQGIRPLDFAAEKRRFAGR